MEDALAGKPDVEPVATCSSSERAVRASEGTSGLGVQKDQNQDSATATSLTKKKENKVWRLFRTSFFNSMVLIVGLMFCGDMCTD